MLSICIPVYNYNVNQLINELGLQADALKCVYEIIIIDDASQPEYHRLNAQLTKRQFVRYYRLKENIGRAAIRNKFLSLANFDYLLFLDCDTRTTNSYFICNYLEIIEQKPEVVCGGIIYIEIDDTGTSSLRIKYGKKRESKTARQRTKAKKNTFLSSNFLIKKTIFAKIQFDQRIKRYGHEDTLFGFQLLQHNITITHIENPLFHLDKETNYQFIRKTEQSIENLVEILENFNIDPQFFNYITLLKTYKKIKNKHLTRFILPIFIFLRLFLKRYFIKNGTNLLLFDLYKLVLFYILFRKKA